MDYAQTLDYLFSQLPMFTRIGAAAIKKDITNTRLLCTALGEPQHKFRTIHIAGTNGKGSVSHMLAAIFQSAGYKTGLYTSPHLKDFRERIKINGKEIPEDTVVDFVAKYRHVFEQISPSFFEMTVGLAFDHFAREKTDIAIIETGLGGRLDSTNIITPELSVITNIGWDHTDLLGDTLGKIAAEKAGIIKPHIPVVVGEFLPETKPIFVDTAAANEAPLVFAEESFSVDATAATAGLACHLTDLQTGAAFEVITDLGGWYQQKNVRTVLTACKVLDQQGIFSLSREHVREGIAHAAALTGLQGRWQKLGEHPLTYCDTGHNKDGIQEVVKQIGRQPFEELHMVIGMVKDKDIGAVLSLLPKKARYYFTQAKIPRALDALELQQQAAAAGLYGMVIPDVRTALETAREAAGENDFVFVGGSTFVVAEVV